jgi:hypothetical protein
MSMTTIEKVQQLRTLLGQTGILHHKRIKLAKEIIDDKQWILTNFGGDEFRAAEVLEKEYFGDLCGAINFWRLIKIIEEYPDVKDWETFNFNLTEMSAIIDTRNRTKRNRGTTRWSVTQRDYEELEAEKNRFQKLFTTKNSDVEKKDARIKELEEAVKQLIREKARLEGKVAELEEIIEAFDVKKSA